MAKNNIPTVQAFMIRPVDNGNKCWMGFQMSGPVQIEGNMVHVMIDDAQLIEDWINATHKFARQRGENSLIWTPNRDKYV